MLKRRESSYFLPNIPQLITAYYGTIKIGAIVTAMSPLYKEREVEYQLNDSEAETIIVLDLLYPIVEKIWGQNQTEACDSDWLEGLYAKN